MTEFTVPHEVWGTAGWIMLHFLWVGTIVGLAAWTSRLAVRRLAPQVRYAVALAWFSF